MSPSFRTADTRRVVITLNHPVHRFKVAHGLHQWDPFVRELTLTLSRKVLVNSEVDVAAAVEAATCSFLKGRPGCASFQLR
jgi:hypothetical protein